MSPPDDLRQWLSSVARDGGFSRVGVAPAQLHGPDGTRLHEWLKRGYHGSMGYMAQGPDRRHDARYILPGARAVIMLAAPYDPPPVMVPPRRSNSPPIASPVPQPPPGTVGIAAYATGEDYHIVLKQRVRDHILPALQQRWPGEHFRCVTDSAPLLERAYAVRAGLGFIGKNTLHIIPGQGSFHFLAAVVTTADILREWNATPNEKQMPMPNCGQCTRCLDACPTSAFPAPFILDARACISYRTIEDRQSRDYAAEATQHQGLIFGCDICQQVCPYNKSASPTLIPEFLNGRILHRHEPAETFLSAASNRQFARRFQRSPLLRAGRTRILARVRAALANNSPRCNNP